MIIIQKIKKKRQKKIRQGKKSIADFYSELYLEYINDEKNKLVLYFYY